MRPPGECLQNLITLNVITLLDLWMDVSFPHCCTLSIILSLFLLLPQTHYRTTSNPQKAEMGGRNNHPTLKIHINAFRAEVYYSKPCCFDAWLFMHDKIINWIHHGKLTYLIMFLYDSHLEGWTKVSAVEGFIKGLNLYKMQVIKI